MLATLQVTALSDQGMASAPNGVNLTVIARKDDNTLPPVSRPSTTLSAVPSAISSGATFTLTGTMWIAWVTSLA
ncbi:hypothetical protein BCU53_017815 [Vibrio lentus]|uniref:hypothetical protein n=1 Tax=Vibrio lentus TaxID=136468 RepID=UPI0039A426E4